MQRLFRPTILCLTTLLSFSFTAHAAINVLDFDSFQNGQIVDNQYLASHGVSIDSVNYKGNEDDVLGLQVAFNTLNNNSRDNDLEFNNNNNDYNDIDSAYSYTALNMPGYSGASDPGNVLILQENNEGCSDGICDTPDDEASRAAGYFEFSFTSLVSILNIDFFDVEDKAGQDQKFYAIQFFDGDNKEIHKNNYVPTMGDGQFVRQAFTGIDNVKRLVLNMPGSGAIDNLAFRTAEVPEPGTLAILFVALGFSLRYKRMKKAQN
jgi:hypothetical protein